MTGTIKLVVELTECHLSAISRIVDTQNATYPNTSTPFSVESFITDAICAEIFQREKKSLKRPLVWKLLKLMHR